MQLNDIDGPDDANVLTAQWLTSVGGCDGGDTIFGRYIDFDIDRQGDHVLWLRWTAGQEHPFAIMHGRADASLSDGIVLAGRSYLTCGDFRGLAIMLGIELQEPTSEAL